MRWVGKYRILAELGRGGMSNVYLAVARGPGGVNKLVVLKAVLPELASEPGALTMFLDEARLAAQLNHPNVVQTYEVGTEGDRHVIVMEHLEGQTLGHVVRTAEQAGNRMSVAMHLRIIMGALEGLHYAHELAGYDGAPLMLVHRDVSPQNIFVTYRGQVKVLDFGIAKAASSSTHTATGVVKGKIAYMAPEQMVADHLDRRADIFSVGCILWAAATGRKLWKDTPDVHIMRRVINGDIPTPQSANQGCDDELNRIVMKALAIEPDRRYETALALQEDLEHYCERFTPVKQKDIGAFVSNLFSSARAEMKTVLDRQLSQALSEEGGSTSDLSVRSEVRLHASAPINGPTSSSTSTPNGTAISNTARSGGASSEELVTLRDTSLLAETPTPAPRKRGLLLALLLLGLLGVGGVVYARQQAAQTSSREIAPIVAAPAAAPSSVKEPSPVKEESSIPATATIQFRVTPPEAELYLDDQRLPSNPTSKVLPVDGKVHQLRAEAPGYVPSIAEFSATRDDAIELTLSKNSEKDAKSVTRRVRARVPAAPPAPAPSARPTKPSSCAQPFYVDSEGIKKVRPECI